MQNIRFQNKILYTVDLPEAAEQFLVPKLIIQPLVENAIEHGFISSEGGRIILSADLDEKEMYIAVTNTGRVIEAEQVERLNWCSMRKRRMHRAQALVC